LTRAKASDLKKIHLYLISSEYEREPQTTMNFISAGTVNPKWYKCLRTRNKYRKILEKSQVGRWPHLPKKISSDDQSEKRIEKEQSGSRKPKLLRNPDYTSPPPPCSRFYVNQLMTFLLL